MSRLGVSGMCWNEESFSNMNLEKRNETMIKDSQFLKLWEGRNNVRREMMQSQVFQIPERKGMIIS